MKHFADFVKVNGHWLWTEFQPGQNGAPIWLELNGLSSTTEDWQKFNCALQKPGQGILRFDFRGQGRSLQKEISEKGEFLEQVTVAEQADDTMALLQHFQIQSPCLLLAESYGGAVALDLVARNSDAFSKVILIAPYLIRLDQAHPLQRIWSMQLHWFRQSGIIQRSVSDAVQSWYRTLLARYMDHRFFNEIRDREKRAAAILLTFGSFDFNAFQKIGALPEGLLHLITAGRDSLVPRQLFREFWHRLSPKVRQSWLTVEDGEHLLLQQHPALLATWVSRILADDPKLSHPPQTFSIWSSPESHESVSAHTSMRSAVSK